MLRITESRSDFVACRSGETGRRRGLKILRALRPCRFNSDLRHQAYKKGLILLGSALFLCFPAWGGERVFYRKLLVRRAA